MKKINSKQTGLRMLSTSQSIATAILATTLLGACAVVVLLPISIYIKLVIGLILAGAAIITFLSSIRDKDKFDRSLIILAFRLRDARGMTTILPLTLSTKDMQSLVELKEIHDDGLIEKKSNNWSVLFRYDPQHDPADNNSDREKAYQKGLESLVNSISPDISVSFHSWNQINRDRKYEKYLLKMLNDPSKTPEQLNHINGLFRHITESSVPKTDVGHLMEIQFGTLSSVERAEAAVRMHVPGLISQMHELEMTVAQVRGEDDVCDAYREMAVMEGIHES